MGDILGRVRNQAQSQGLDEDDFERVLEEINKQKEKRQKEITDKLKLAGVMDFDKLMFYLERETSKAMQQSSQIDEPDYGILLDSMLLDDGCVVNHADFCIPRIEPELTFVLKDGLKGPNVGLRSVFQNKRQF